MAQRISASFIHLGLERKPSWVMAIGRSRNFYQSIHYRFRHNVSAQHRQRAHSKSKSCLHSSLNRLLRSEVLQSMLSLTPSSRELLQSMLFSIQYMLYACLYTEHFEFQSLNSNRQQREKKVLLPLLPQRTSQPI